MEGWVGQSGVAGDGGGAVTLPGRIEVLSVWWWCCWPQRCGRGRGRGRARRMPRSAVGTALGLTMERDM